MSDIFTRTKRIGVGMPRRTEFGVFAHFRGEVDELGDEIALHVAGIAPGPDGINGEIMDCIACLVDLYQIHNPTATEEDFLALFQTKLDKWKAVYSNPEGD